MRTWKSFLRIWLGRYGRFFLATASGKSGAGAPRRGRRPGRLGGAGSRLLLEVLETRTLPSGYTLSTLSFSGSNPPTVTSLVVDTSGDVFGTTEYGGQYGDGSIIEVSHGSSVTLASFNGTNGSARAASSWTGTETSLA